MTQSTCLLDNCISLGRASGAQQMYQSEEVLVWETCGNLELEAGRRVRCFRRTSSRWTMVAFAALSAATWLLVSRRWQQPQWNIPTMTLDRAMSSLYVVFWIPIGLQKLGKKNMKQWNRWNNLKIFIWNTLECDCPKMVCDLFGLRWRIPSRTANHLMVLGLPLGRKDLCELGIFVGCKKSRFYSIYRFSTCCGWDAYPLAGFWP